MKILKQITNVFIIVLCISLFSCKEEMKFDKSQLIDNSSSFDKKEFIDQSKDRSKEVFELGPRVDETEKNIDKKRYRKLVNKEESFNYADINVLESKNFKISINAENMEIREFTNMISRATGVNILVSDEVQGKVSAKLKDVYWTSMLDSILNTKRLAKYVDTKSNIIRIHDQSTVVQLEDFEQKRKENVQRALQLQKASQPLYTEIFKLFYTDPENVKKQLEDVLISSTSTSSNIRDINPDITIDNRKNLIIVKARKEDMNIVAKLITELDTRTQQIFIEAFVVEVDDDFDMQLGTRLGVDYNKGDTRVAGTAGTVSGATTLGNNSNSTIDLGAVGATSGIGVLTNIGNSTDLKLELSAMESQGISKVVSNPRIFTLDNQEAIIFQGDEVPYETVSQDGTQVQFKEAGLKLAVTPTIIGDGNLQLNIQVNKDTVDTTVSNPPITKSEIKTNLVTRDGEIVVMGGIYTQTDSKTKEKVPGLGDIPVIGELFRRDTDREGRKELIIFIVPRVI